MSILLGSMMEKQRLIQWIKDTTTFLVLPFVKGEQRKMLQQHVDRMAAFEGSYDVQCEVSQGSDGASMRLMVTILPRRNQ